MRLLAFPRHPFLVLVYTTSDTQASSKPSSESRSEQLNSQYMRCLRWEVNRGWGSELLYIDVSGCVCERETDGHSESQTEIETLDVSEKSGNGTHCPLEALHEWFGVPGT